MTVVVLFYNVVQKYRYYNLMMILLADFVVF